MVTEVSLCINANFLTPNIVIADIQKKLSYLEISRVDLLMAEGEK